MTTAIDLLPCPFCGGHNVVLGGDDPEDRTAVFCNDCEALGPCGLPQDEEDILKEKELGLRFGVLDAIRQWNKRPADEELRKFQDLYRLLNPSAVERPDAETFRMRIEAFLREFNERQVEVEITPAMCEEYARLEFNANQPLTPHALKGISRILKSAVVALGKKVSPEEPIFRSPEVADHPGYSRLIIRGFNDTGKEVVSASLSAPDPHHSEYLMTSFLMLEEAVRLRGVQIKSHRLGSLYLSSGTATPPPSKGIDTPSDKLNVRQAADFLNVSYPFVLDLINRGEFRFEVSGGAIRIEFSDLRAYKEKMINTSKTAMDELAALDQELGLSKTFVPTGEPPRITGNYPLPLDSERTVEMNVQEYASGDSSSSSSSD